MKKSLAFMLVILLAPVFGASDPFKITTDVPQYVKPGDTFNVSIMVKNETDEDQMNVKVKLLVSPPLEIIGDKEVGLGKLDFEFITTKSAVFKIHVRDNALYGYYDIPIVVTSESAEYRDTLTIRIIGTTLVNVSQISLDREKISAGDTFVLRAAVENKGDNALRWLKVSLNTNPSLMPNPPLIPLTSTETVFLDMSPGARREAIFSISAGKDTQPQSYPVLLTISYKDETDALASYEVPYGVEVLGKATIVFSSIEPDPAEPAENDTIVLNVSLKNVGDIQAKSVKGLAVCKGGRYTAFLPDIAIDESGSLAFTIGTLAPGEYDFTISILWVDEYGQSGEIDENFVLTIEKKEKSYTSFIVGGALVLVVVAGYFLKKRSK